MNFEDLLPHIGWGRYQITNMLIASALMVLTSMHVLSSIFTTYPMPYECKKLQQIQKECGENWNETYNQMIVPFNTNKNGLDQCKYYNYTDHWIDSNNTDICLLLGNASSSQIPYLKTDKCDEHVFTSDGTVLTSTVEDFNMVCDRAWYKYLLQSVFMAGVFFSGIIFGKASDRFGRKNIVLLMTLCALVVSVAIAFVKSFVAYVTLRGLVGFFCFHGPTVYVLVSETAMANRRSMVVLVGSFGFSVGNMLLVPIAYLVRDWITLQLVLTALYALCIALWWLLNESPRWLISRGKETQAIETLHKIMERNNCDPEAQDIVNRFCEELIVSPIQVEHSLLQDHHGNRVNATERKVENLGMLDTLSVPHLRKATIVLTYAWFATSCAFYGLTLNVASVGGNIYVTTLIMASMAIPAYPLAIFCCEKLGRRLVISSSFILVGAFCIPMYFIPVENTGLQVTMFLFGRLFSMIPFSTLFLFTIELYPTVIRSTASNYGSSIARVGAIVAPAIAMTEVLYPTLPNIMFGLITFLAGLLILLLPDTRKVKMCETMEEADSYIRDNPGPLTKLCVKT